MFDFQYIKNAPLSQTGSTGASVIKTREFLLSMGLSPDTDADFTVNIIDEDFNVKASGSLAGNILKFIAVSDSEQGTGAAAAIVSELVNYAYREGITKLFLFTKPKNETMFRSMGFFSLAKTSDSCMMENSRHGFDEFIALLERPSEGFTGTVGAIVANCNPMTNGHMYLFETAAKACDALHIFILSEDKSEFSSDTRYEIVKKATSGIPNLYLHRSSQYIISSATFPTYFMKSTADKGRINADLDLELFGSRIAPALGITKRFVGTEPYCAVTKAYNERMKSILPCHGIEVVEIERLDGISASKVREFIENKQFDEIRKIVPSATFEYIEKKFNDC